MTGQLAPERPPHEEVLVDWVPSPVGPIRLTWTAAGLLELSWRLAETPDASVPPRRRAARPLPDPTDARSRHLAIQLDEYWRTGAVDFLDVPVDHSGQSDFAVTVLQACRRIPPGSTITYGELASRAGFERAARAVGRVMAANRVPLVVPCHRVVGGRGRLVGYSGPGGVEFKRRLLDGESENRGPNALGRH